MDKPLSAVERLSALSLVTKVCSELEMHLGIGDKTLAEFIINLGEDAYDLGYEAFYNRLVDNGLEGEAVARAVFSLIESTSPKIAR